MIVNENLSILHDRAIEVLKHCKFLSTVSFPQFERLHTSVFLDQISEKTFFLLFQPCLTKNPEILVAKKSFFNTFSKTFKKPLRHTMFIFRRVRKVRGSREERPSLICWRLKNVHQWNSFDLIPPSRPIWATKWGGQIDGIDSNHAKSRKLIDT
mgnify:CR=1 FL=1